MLLKTLQNNPLLQYITLLVLSLAIWGGALYTSGFCDWRVWAGWFLSLTCSLAFGMIISAKKLSFDPALHSIMFLCISAPHIRQQLSFPLWLYPLALLILYSILNLYGKERSYPALFNTAFFWSVLTIFQPDLFFSLPCLFIILIAYSMNHWREWVSTLFGILSGYICWLAFCFLSGRMFAFPTWRDWCVSALPQFNASCVFMFGISGLCLILSFLAALTFRSRMQGMEISERHKASALIVMLVYFTVYFIFVPVAFTARFFLFFPLAFLSVKYLQKPGYRWLSETAFLLVVAASVAQAYIGF